MFGEMEQRSVTYMGIMRFGRRGLFQNNLLRDFVLNLFRETRNLCISYKLLFTPFITKQKKYVAFVHQKKRYTVCNLHSP